MVQLCSTSFSSSRLSYTILHVLRWFATHFLSNRFLIGLIPVLVKPHSQWLDFRWLKKTTQNSQSNSIGWNFQILGLKSCEGTDLWHSARSSGHYARLSNFSDPHRGSDEGNEGSGVLSGFRFSVSASILTHEDPKEEDVTIFWWFIDWGWSIFWVYHINWLLGWFFYNLHSKMICDSYIWSHDISHGCVWK